MSEMIIKQSNSIAELGKGQSVLGESQATIPTGGRIRSGIMVLTNASKSIKGATEIYNKGLAAGKSFNEIGADLYKATDGKAKLTPKNVDYFTVRESDFNLHGTAKMIMDKYGEDRGHGRRLYRFPVIFPLDNWQAVMPHEFVCYTASEKKYWSEYDQAGNRLCMMKQPIQKGHRIAGGRPTIKRPDNEGICNPDACPEYQSNPQKCKMHGKFKFYIPGIPGAAAIELPTSSIYSMMQARQAMEMVSFITGGKISGTWNGEPIFWISKKSEKVSMIDHKTGQAKKVSQFLISLDANVNMTDMFKQAEASNMLEAGSQAADAIGYSQDEFDDCIQGDVVEDENVHELRDSETHQVPEQKQNQQTGQTETTKDDTTTEPSEVILINKINAAKSQDDLMEVANELNKIKDKGALKRIRDAMSKKHKELGAKS